MSNFLVISENVTRTSRYVCQHCLKGEMDRDVRITKGKKVKSKQLPDTENHFLVCNNTECKAEVGITPDFVYPIIEDFGKENRIFDPIRNLNNYDTLINKDGMIVTFVFIPNGTDYPDNHLEAVRHGRFMLSDMTGKLLEADILDDETLEWKKSDIRIRSEVVNSVDPTSIPETDEFTEEANQDPNMDLDANSPEEDDTMDIDLSLFPIDTEKFTVWNGQIYIKLKQENAYKRFDMNMRKICATETSYIELFFVKKDLEIYNFEDALKLTE